MKKPALSNGTSYVTYKWLLSILIGSCASLLAIVGGLANATYYTRSAGAAIEEKTEATDRRLDTMEEMLKEVRQDVKVLIARKR